MRRKSLLSGLIYMLILMVVGYMAYYIYVAISTPLKTAEAVLYTAEEIVSVKGYFFRDEIPVPAGKGPVQQMLVSGGEKVHKGQVISVSYESEEDMKIYQQLAWEQELLSLLYEAIGDENIVDIDRVDRSIARHLEDLVYGIENPKSVNLKYAADRLKAQVLKRGLAFSNTGKEQVTAEISRLTSKIRSLSATVEKGAASVISPESGYFSPAVDGFEGILTLDRSDTLTLTQFNEIESLRRSEELTAYCGRLATNYKWRFAVSLPAEYANLLSEGDRVRLRFTGDYISEVRLPILRIDDDDQSHSCLVVLSGTTNTSELLVLRYQSADIIMSTYEGIRVPKQALRINSEGKAGVYCLVALQAKFVETEQLYELDHYYIVSYDPKDADGLRPGDEIIVSSKKLYDGKIVQ